MGFVTVAAAMAPLPQIRPRRYVLKKRNQENFTFSEREVTQGRGDIQYRQLRRCCHTQNKSINKTIFNIFPQKEKTHMVEVGRKTNAGGEQSCFVKFLTTRLVFDPFVQKKHAKKDFFSHITR